MKLKTKYSSLTLLLVARKPTPSDFQHKIPITRDRTPVVTDLCCLLRLILKTEECGKSTEGRSHPKYTRNKENRVAALQWVAEVNER